MPLKEFLSGKFSPVSFLLYTQEVVSIVIQWIYYEYQKKVQLVVHSYDRIQEETEYLFFAG